MPPTSRKQAALFRAVESGSVKLSGMTKKKAHEMVSGYPTKDLPKTAKPKKK